MLRLSRVVTEEDESQLTNEARAETELAWAMPCKEEEGSMPTDGTARGEAEFTQTIPSRDGRRLNAS
ncbi:MAG: hypothetical protein PUC02_04475 [Bacteroidales bacterium]|nr:hypothetical protein [Bacteroidales bacterium]